jgi:Transposase zinc-binding domain
VCPVAPKATAATASLRLTLADLVRAHGDAYRRSHRLATVQTLALRAIAACRTALLGGRRETCDHCGATRIRFNSCRNRHCPTCQAQASARWLDARRAELLPIPYFHVVFTLPHALNALAQGNPRVIYALLFRAAADTLLTFGRDPRHLGGTIGITAVLHTWGQTLTQHPHS